MPTLLRRHWKGLYGVCAWSWPSGCSASSQTAPGWGSQRTDSHLFLNFKCHRFEFSSASCEARVGGSVKDITWKCMKRERIWRGSRYWPEERVLGGNLSAFGGAAYCCRLILCHPTNHIVCVGAAPFYRATAPRHAVWPSIYLTGRMRREKKGSKWKYGEKKSSRFEMKPLTSLFFLLFFL